MKKQLFILVALNVSFIAMNGQQWEGSTANSGDIHREGNVGIGINTPKNKLQITSKGASSASTELEPEKWQAGIGDVSGTDQGEVLIGTIGKQPAIQGHGMGTLYRLLLNPFDGNVGVGLIYPDRKFHVSSTGNHSSGLEPSKWQAGFGNIKNNMGEVLVGTYGNQPAIQGHGSGTSYRLLLNPYQGNVGIGTNNPAYKLDVSGTIRAQEIKVNLNGADFVFDDNYNLRSLEEVETFIKTNKHLPDIAPAEEMEANGADLGEMNSKLLQKVEELTLYTIEQEKEIEKLKKQNAEIEKLKQILKRNGLK